MRRILPDRPQTPAERNRRWRQNRLDARVAATLADLTLIPDHIDPAWLVPIITEWYRRGFQRPPTKAQLAALTGLPDPRVADLAVEALREAPRTGPAYGVWGVVLTALQDFRARMVAKVHDAIHPRVIAHALRLTDHPVMCGTCGRPPSVRYSNGTWGFPCSHAPTRDVPPPIGPPKP